MSMTRNSWLSLHAPPRLCLPTNSRSATIAAASRRTTEQGVAQGSPLSPLFGNVLLHAFDHRFNGRGIVCVRFIDDFALLGEFEAKVAKAFANARTCLAELGLTCHDPYGAGTNRMKSARGTVASGFDFLGYRIEPGLLQPSFKARKKVSRPSTSNCGSEGGASTTVCVKPTAWRTDSATPRLRHD